MRKGVVQATLKGRQWRHGVVVWAFMVAGLIGRRLPGSTDPCFVSLRRRRRPGRPSTAARRRPSPAAMEASNSGSLSDNEYDTNSDADSESGGWQRDSRRHGNVGTDDTMSGGEERAEDEPLQRAEETSEAFKQLFGDRPMHEAVLHVVCLTARLMGKLCGDNQADDVRVSDDGAMQLQREAYELVCRYVAVLFGPINTTKMHSLAFHLIDELLHRGNLVEADTSVNEMLHRLLKVMFENTNKQTTSFAVQMLRCEQTLAHIITEDADDKMRAEAGLPPVDQGAMDEPLVRNFGATFGDHSPRIQQHDDSDKSCPNANEAADDADDEAPEEDERPAKRARAAPHDAGRRRRSRVRLRGRRSQVAHLVAEDGGRLRQLPDLLGVSKHQHLLVANSQKFEAVLSWRTARLQQHIRAARDLYRKTWYDFIVYHDAAYPGEAQVGLARLIVRAVDGRRYDSIIVQRMQAAEPRKGCVLSDFGCRRLKWAINNTTGFPDLADVKLVDVERLEHVVPDFEDLCERHGLRGTPSTIPDTPRERLLQRYFTSIFFPWTSNSIDESPGL